MKPTPIVANNDFDEFSPVLKFVVSQYSALLFTPEFYTADNGNVTFNDSLFSSISNDSNRQKLDIFKSHLKAKLEYDLSVRKERRNSLTGMQRPRVLSGSKRVATDNIQSSLYKSARVPPPSSSSS